MHELSLSINQVADVAPATKLESGNEWSKTFTWTAATVTGESIAIYTADEESDFDAHS